MRFIEVNGFTIRPDKQRAFQEWFVANQQRMARSYPEGSGLVGIFAAVYSSEKQAGDIFVLEQLDSYGAEDRLAAAGKDPSNEHAQVLNEFLAFLDPDPRAPFSKILLKDLVDATVFDMPAVEAKEAVPA